MDRPDRYYVYNPIMGRKRVPDTHSDTRARAKDYALQMQADNLVLEEGSPSRPTKITTIWKREQTAAGWPELLTKLDIDLLGLASEQTARPDLAEAYKLVIADMSRRSTEAYAKIEAANAEQGVTAFRRQYRYARSLSLAVASLEWEAASLPS